MTNGINVNQLKSFIERVEKLRLEQDAIGEDITEVYKELKSHGFDDKIVKKIIRLRAMDPDKRANEIAMLELYASAIDLQGVLPI